MYSSARDRGVAQIVADAQAGENFFGTPQPFHRDALLACERALAFEKDVELHRSFQQTSDAEHTHHFGRREDRRDLADQVATSGPDLIPRALGHAQIQIDVGK